MEQQTTTREGLEKGGSAAFGWREGYALLDPLGQRIGRVERVFFNPSDEPEYVRIRTGFLGRKLILIPVQDVAVDREGKTLTLK